MTVQPLGKDIGYLPGTMEEKMLPWLMPIQDNLQFLLGNEKSALQMYMEKGKIEIEALKMVSENLSEDFSKAIASILKSAFCLHLIRKK